MCHNGNVRTAGCRYANVSSTSDSRIEACLLWSTSVGSLWCPMAVISSASWEDCLVAVELQPIYALQFEKLCLKQILFLLAHQLHLLQVDRVISCIAHACLCTGRFRGNARKRFAGQAPFQRYHNTTNALFVMFSHRHLPSPPPVAWPSAVLLRPFPADLQLQQPDFRSPSRRCLAGLSRYCLRTP